jgi:hypothetical protein
VRCPCHYHLTCSSAQFSSAQFLSSVPQFSSASARAASTPTTRQSWLSFTAQQPLHHPRLSFNYVSLAAALPCCPYMYHREILYRKRTRGRSQTTVDGSMADDETEEGAVKGKKNLMSAVLGVAKAKRELLAMADVGMNYWQQQQQQEEKSGESNAGGRGHRGSQ